VPFDFVEGLEAANAVTRACLLPVCTLKSYAFKVE